MEEEAREAAQFYADKYGLTLAEYVDTGKDGTIWVVESQSNPLNTIVKIHHGSGAFLREVRCYERLREKRASLVKGFVVPRLLRVDADLLALEITIVSPPFLVDFASAYLDAPPDFSEEVWEDWAADYAERFGERWETVEAVLNALKIWGIYQLDPSPANIRFE